MNDILDLIEDSVDAKETAIPSDDGLKRIRLLATEVRQIDAAADPEFEGSPAWRLAENGKRRRELTEKLLPTVMKELGIPYFELDDGSGIEVKPGVYANVKEENRAAAHQWLRDNGFGDLIKREIKVAFGRGEDSLADSLITSIIALDKDCVDKQAVAPQTLQAFVREQYAKGKLLPPADLFGVHIADVAVVKPPAKGKRKG